MRRTDRVWLAAMAWTLAQTVQAEPGSVRYAPIASNGPTLYPAAPGQDAVAPQLLRALQNGVDYAANAEVGRIVVELDRDAVPADGQSPVRITLRLSDRQGAPLAGTALVTVEASAGRLLLPGARTDELGPRALDLDRSTPGVQLKVVNGQATLTLLAPAQAQDVRLRVTAGDQEAAGTVSFVPDLRPMIAAGLLEGVIRLRGGSAVTPVQRGDVFEREIRAWSRDFNASKANIGARAAFYLKGTVRGDLLLTAAYDSDKDTRARLLRDIRPDEVYPVYGDASLKSIDAKSAERLFVRIDKAKSYLLYGDFATGDGFSQPQGQGAAASLKQRSLGAYLRSATGLRSHHEAAGVVANGFAFHDSLRQAVQEFASQGSGPYGLANNAVLEGSEKVEVIVRDRQQPSRIVSVRALQRLLDYSFEPFSGRIVLSTFLHSLDSQLNPVSLRVSYEVDQGGAPFWVYGLDAQWQLLPRLEWGGSAVQDRNPLAPYELYSANATMALGPRTTLVAEVARSTSSVNTNVSNSATTAALAGRVGEVQGGAWRVELAHEDERSRARAFVGRSSPSFNNPAAPLNGGRGEAQAEGRYTLTDTLTLQADALKSEDRNPGGGTRSATGLGLRWLAGERLSLEFGLRSRRETVGSLSSSLLSSPFSSTAGLSGSIASGSGGGALGFGQQVLDPATGLPVIVQGGGLGQALSSLPVGTRLASDSLRLGLGWRLSERINLGAEVENSVSGDSRRRYSLGADYQVAERTRLYARAERQEGWVQLAGVSGLGRSADALVFGVDSSYLQDTQLFSEYRLRDAASGRDLQMASGIRQQFNIADGWRASAGYEQVNVISGSTARTRAVMAGLDWTAHPLWRASTKLEFRHSGDLAGTPTDDSFSTLLWQATLARKLDRDWTLLAKRYLLATDYVARGDVRQERSQLGLAYRDTDTNRTNALAKIEFKSERDASGANSAAVGELRSRTWIISAHADHHPSRPWWLTGRVAAKWQNDRFEAGVTDGFNAQLLAGRAVYDITEHWDIGVLAAMLRGQHGAQQRALGVEAGYLLVQNLWLSAGVNFSGFAGDADLVGYEYTQRGAYLRLRLKFDETLFKRHNPVVNRSLDR